MIEKMTPNFPTLLTASFYFQDVFYLLADSSLIPLSLFLAFGFSELRLQARTGIPLKYVLMKS